MEEERKDIKSLCALLNRENKQYVLAVANALLFSQKKAEEETLKMTAGQGK